MANDIQSIHAGQLTGSQCLSTCHELPPPLTFINTLTIIVSALCGRTATAAFEYLLKGSRFAISCPGDFSDSQRVFQRGKHGHTIIKPIFYSIY